MPISPESDYCLTGSTILGEIGVHHCEYAHRYGLNIDELIDNRLLLPEELIRSFTGFKQTATHRQLDELVILAHRQTSHIFEEYVGRHVNSLEKLVLDENPDITLEAFVNKPDDWLRSNILEHYQTNQIHQNWSYFMRELFELACETFNRIKPSEIAKFLAEEDRIVREQRHLALGINTDISFEKMERKSLVAKKQKLVKTRKGIKKAVKLFDNVLGSENWNAFLKEDGYTISSDMFDYKFVKKLDIIKMSENDSYASPFDLAIYDKSNTKLANLCVYFEQTPIIDQLIGMYLYIKHAETEFLNKANFFNVQKAAHTNENLITVRPDRFNKPFKERPDIFDIMPSIGNQLDAAWKDKTFVRRLLPFIAEGANLPLKYLDALYFHDIVGEIAEHQQIFLE